MYVYETVDLQLILPLISLSLAQDLLNHCFDDMEVFMGKLQQSAEAQMILNQRSKKNKRSQKKSADGTSHITHEKLNMRSI